MDGNSSLTSFAAGLDFTAIARACERYGVARLRVFGSALTEAFDPETSDVDFLVEYKPDAIRTFQSLFGLREELEHITGRAVDLVDVQAIRNPYFAHSAMNSARDVYAA